MARSVLGALGAEVFVEDESYLDMATALSGSGPAYVFLFTEALIDAGVHMGFPRRIAEQLVLQTIKGSASFYEQAERHPATLRNQVTSPGGTSAEALYYLEKAGFRTAISRAVFKEIIAGITHLARKSPDIFRTSMRSMKPDRPKLVSSSSIARITVI